MKSSVLPASSSVSPPIPPRPPSSLCNTIYLSNLLPTHPLSLPCHRPRLKQSGTGVLIRAIQISGGRKPASSSAIALQQDPSVGFVLASFFRTNPAMHAASISSPPHLSLSSPSHPLFFRRLTSPLILRFLVLFSPLSEQYNIAYLTYFR